MHSVLRLQSISVCQRRTQILDEIDWQVNQGQHWAIMGANGSGKSTLLNVLLAYTPATRGQIELLGKAYGHYDWRELRKEVGLVGPAITAMMPPGEPAERVVRSGVSAMIGSWGEPPAGADARAGELLERIGCSALRGRPWFVLSQGERQRLLIGRALMANPKLLILDEPCAGLDPVSRESFLGFLQDLAKSGGAPTLIFVTHHVEEIMPVLSHLLILKAGRVLAQGETEAILNGGNLSQAFDRTVTVQKTDGRYTLHVPAPNRIA